MASSDAISPTSLAHAAPRGHRAAVIASFLGWTLDAFDFFLVVFALTAIAKEFHKTDAEIALTITVTLAFRPVGAFIFGLMADRYGRKLPLMIDLVFFSIVEVLTGFAPNFTTFFILRDAFSEAERRQLIGACRQRPVAFQIFASCSVVSLSS